MKLGTKSLLYGAHAFWLHPFMVARAWYLLYGFPWDLRLWFCFFFHDIGYWGCPNMDGPRTGKLHPYRGAIWASRLFDKRRRRPTHPDWFWFSLLHSQSITRDYEYLGAKPSSLCWPDKLATILVPRWLYLTLVWLTGEVEDYKSNMGSGLTNTEWYGKMCYKVSKRLSLNLSPEQHSRVNKYLHTGEK